MTKRHFIKVASILKDHVEDEKTRRMLAGLFADWFRSVNSRFYADRFMEAAGCG